MRLRRRSSGEIQTFDPARDELGSGGEGRILAVPGSPDLAAKIYHRPAEVRWAKLEAMVERPPRDPMAGKGHTSFVWPLDILEEGGSGRAPVGFVMSRVAWVESLAEIAHPGDRMRRRPSFHYRALLRTAANLASALGALHERGYVVGDVNDSNILVTKDAMLTWVDTDSFQVPDPSGEVHRCRVGRDLFTPPELQGADLGALDRAPEHDLFGLGVLTFQLVMEGTHPFAGVPRTPGDAPDLAGRIRAGNFPHGFGSVPFDPPPAAPPFSILYPDLQSLFRRCFEDGHRQPGLRPDARTFQAVIEKAEAALVQCGRNPQHMYPGHLTSCAWCARRAQLGGRDPFPDEKEVRRRRAARLRRPGGPSRASSTGLAAPAFPAPPPRSRAFRIATLLLGGAGLVGAAAFAAHLTETESRRSSEAGSPDAPALALTQGAGAPAGAESPPELALPPLAPATAPAATAVRAGERAKRLAQRRKLGPAAAAWRQAVQIDPAYGEAWGELGETLYRLGKLDESEAAARTAVERASTPEARAVALYRLARIAEKRGRMTEATGYYRASLVADPVGGVTR